MASPTTELYGLEVSEMTGLKSGSLYPILSRLEEQGWLISTWESIDPSTAQRPRRRFYRLTGEGIDMAQGVLETRQAAGRLEQQGTVARSVHRIKIEVEETRPIIWRRIDIDSQASLDNVHMAIQIGFGWENFHLHHFQIGYDSYSSSPNYSGENSDSRSVTLGSVTTVGDRLGYVYD